MKNTKKSNTPKTTTPKTAQLSVDLLRQVVGGAENAREELRK